MSVNVASVPSITPFPAVTLTSGVAAAAGKPLTFRLKSPARPRA